MFRDEGFLSVCEGVPWADNDGPCPTGSLRAVMADIKTVDTSGRLGSWRRLLPLGLGSGPG